jgi:hypothetical protein
MFGFLFEFTVSMAAAYQDGNNLNAKFVGSECVP